MTRIIQTTNKAINLSLAKLKYRKICWNLEWYKITLIDKKELALEKLDDAVLEEIEDEDEEIFDAGEELVSLLIEHLFKLTM